MRGAVMYGAGDVRVEDVPDARLLDPTDALVRVTRAAICGSDLWLYKSMPQDAYPTLSSIEESPVQAVYATGIEPTWSSDGKRIAFTSDPTSHSDIFAVNASGGGLKKITKTRFAEFAPAWAPTRRR